MGGMEVVKHISTLADHLVWREAGGLWGDEWQKCAAYVKTGKRNLSVRKCNGGRVMRVWSVMWANAGTSVHETCSRGETETGKFILRKERPRAMRERRWLKNGTLNDMYHLNSRGWRIKNTCQLKLLIVVGVGVVEQQCRSSRSDVGISKSCRGSKFLSTGTRSTRCTEGSCESSV